MSSSLCQRCSSLASVAGPSVMRRTFTSSTSLLAKQASKKKSSSSSSSTKKKVGPNPNAMTIVEAVQVLRSVESSRPFSAYELEVVTKFDKTAPPLRGRLALPRDARKKEEVVLVFADGNLAEEAKVAGASFVGGEELIDQVLAGQISPTKVLSTTSLLPTIAPKLSRYLGQKGLMPSIKRGTVTDNISAAIKEAKGLLDWRGDKQGHVRAAVARITFPTEDVEANIRSFVKAVKEGTNTSSASDNSLSSKKKASSILKVNLSSTMGPAIELNDAMV